IAIVQGGLIRVVIPKLGQKRALYAGLISYIIGFILYAFANESWMMFAFSIPYCLGAISGPAIQGIISTKVAANEQGELQGIMAAMMSISSIIGPLLMTNLFSTFTARDADVYFPGAPFIAGAVLTVIGLLLSIRSLVKYHTPAVQPETEQEAILESGTNS
ncbi:MAG: MFS transporter, partial [Chitinophagaceae bacterium]|nr:MFS transporter [Chitinophagaceae bacterium]